MLALSGLGQLGSLGLSLPVKWEQDWQRVHRSTNAKTSPSEPQNWIPVLREAWKDFLLGPCDLLCFQSCTWCSDVFLSKGVALALSPGRPGIDFRWLRPQQVLCVEHTLMPYSHTTHLVCTTHCIHMSHTSHLCAPHCIHVIRTSLSCAQRTLRSHTTHTPFTCHTTLTPFTHFPLVCALHTLHSQVAHPSHTPPTVHSTH